MTLKEAKNIALQKYIELWGEDWFNARVPSIGDSIDYGHQKVYEYTIDQSDSLMPMSDEPRRATTLEDIMNIKFGGETPPQHSTRFRIDLNKNSVEVIDHY